MIEDDVAIDTVAADELLTGADQLVFGERVIRFRAGCWSLRLLHPARERNPTHRFAAHFERWRRDKRLPGSGILRAFVADEGANDGGSLAGNDSQPASSTTSQAGGQTRGETVSATW